MFGRFAEPPLGGEVSNDDAQTTFINIRHLFLCAADEGRECSRLTHAPCVRNENWLQHINHFGNLAVNICDRETVKINSILNTISLARARLLTLFSPWRTFFSADRIARKKMEQETRRKRSNVFRERKKGESNCNWKWRLNVAMYRYSIFGPYVCVCSEKTH